jgi:DNA-binding PadR family transcriptional regulator
MGDAITRLSVNDRWIQLQKDSSAGLAFTYWKDSDNRKTNYYANVDKNSSYWRHKFQTDSNFRANDDNGNFLRLSRKSQQRKSRTKIQF